MSNNVIIQRVYLLLNIKLSSPLSVSGGEEEFTDSDVMKDYDGHPFIPGTSIAGAMREYLNEKDAVDLFGDAEGKKSNIIIYDANFVEGEYEISSRDGIQLDDQKQTIEGAKYNYEVIQTGAKTVIRVELLVRKNCKTIEKIKSILYGIQKGYIRFGHNKNRGNGRVLIESVFSKEYSRDGVSKDWTEFLWDEMKEDTNNWLCEVNKEQEKYDSYKIPLLLQGGISIRKYSSDPSKADFEHITCNNKPVIPGTSWNGAIRHHSKRILKELGLADEDASSLLDDCFGYVDKEGKEAKPSKIIFTESIVEKSVRVPMTRTRINRFDNSTMHGALYSEIANFTGSCELEIMVENDAGDWIGGLLALIVKDLDFGYLAIGGQTSIGRGLFSLDKTNACSIFPDEHGLLQELKNKIDSLKTRREA